MAAPVFVPKVIRYFPIHLQSLWQVMGKNTITDLAEFLRRHAHRARTPNCQENSRVQQSKGTGKGRADVYISKWFAWEALKFLEDPEEIRTKISNYSEEELTENNIENVEAVEAADEQVPKSKRQ
ncbi:hypothetical protein CBL_08478 [Carabus blaptoides fortunei]